MDESYQGDFAGALGTQAGRAELMKGIVDAVEPEPGTADDDLDRWWGTVEIDRVASGLTLAAIAILSEPDGEDGLGGAWLEKTDPDGDEPTRLTPDGREALRGILAASSDNPLS